MISNPGLTRWLGYYSYLLLLQRFNVPYTAVWSHCTPALRKHAPPAWVWVLVDCIVVALQPLFLLLKKLQRHANDFLLSDALAAVINTNIHCNEMLRTRLEQVKASRNCAEAMSLEIHLLNNISTAFRKNFAFLHSFDKKKAHYVVSLLIDPRFKDLALLRALYESEGSVDAAQQLHEMARQVLAGPFQTYLTAAHLHRFPPALDPGPATVAAGPAWADLVGLTPAPVLTPAQAAMKEYNTFLKTTFPNVHPKLSPLTFWPQHVETLPTLSLLAEAFCGINRSEVKVESQLSVRGLLTLERRNSLGEELGNAYCQICSALPRNSSATPNKQPKSAPGAKDKALQFAEEENLLLRDTQAGPDGFANIGNDGPTAEEERILDLQQCLKVLQAFPLDPDFLNNSPFAPDHN